MRFSPLILLSLAAIAGCATDDTAATDDLVTRSQPDMRRGAAPILTVRTDCAPGPALAVDEASLVGDYATVIAEHAGGCGEHTYEVCWNGLVAVSDPPQVLLELRHRTDDTCEALIRQPVVIDLEELQSDSSPGPIQVGFPGGARVLYMP